MGVFFLLYLFSPPTTQAHMFIRFGMLIVVFPILGVFDGL